MAGDGTACSRRKVPILLCPASPGVLTGRSQSSARPQGTESPCHVLGKWASDPACGLAKPLGHSADRMPEMLGLSMSSP